MNWSVYSFTLLLKTQVEYENARTKDRAILQLQVLIDQLTNETTPLINQNHKDSQFNAPIWERLMVSFLIVDHSIVYLFFRLSSFLGNEENISWSLFLEWHSDDGSQYLQGIRFV